MTDKHTKIKSTVRVLHIPWKQELFFIDNEKCYSLISENHWVLKKYIMSPPKAFIKNADYKILSKFQLFLKEKKLTECVDVKKEKIRRSSIANTSINDAHNRFRLTFDTNIKPHIEFLFNLIFQNNLNPIINSSISSKKLPILLVTDSENYANRRILPRSFNIRHQHNDMLVIDYDVVLDKIYVYPIMAKSPCLNCYYQRRNEARIYRSEHIIIDVNPIIWRSEHLDFIIKSIKTLIQKMRSQNNTYVFEIDFKKSKITKYRILSFSSCQVCSPKKIPNTLFTSRYFKRGIPYDKKVTSGLGQYTHSHFEIYEKIQPLIGPVGIIAKIENSGVRLFKGAPPKMKMIASTPYERRNNAGRYRYGKGISDEDVLISGLMETIEYYYLNHPVREMVRSSYNNIKHKAVNPYDFILPNNIDYDNNTIIDWTWSYSLTRKRAMLVPADLIYSYKENRVLPENAFGSASGSNIIEAVMSALIEIIERDALVIAELSGSRIKDVIIDTNNINISKAINILRNNRVDYQIKYLTNNIALPCFGVLLKGRYHGNDAYSYAAGCHVDKNIALSRAILEAIQLYPQIKSKSLWLQERSISYLEGIIKTTNFSSIPNPIENISTNNKIKFIVDAFSSVCADVFISVLTAKNSSLSVVKSLATVLQPDYCKMCYSQIPRFSKRLFEIPYIMGWKNRIINASNLITGSLCGHTHHDD